MVLKGRRARPQAQCGAQGRGWHTKREGVSLVCNKTPTVRVSVRILRNYVGIC